MSRNSIIDRIRQEDPSYDPIGPACEAAKVDRETFRAALSRVVIDGNYGPISDDDWREQDGREPSNVQDALDVLQKVSDEIDDYSEEVSDVRPDCDGETQTEACDSCEGTGFVFWVEKTVDAREIRRDVFSAVIEIYGSLPW